MKPSKRVKKKKKVVATAIPVNTKVKLTPECRARYLVFHGKDPVFKIDTILPNGFLIRVIDKSKKKTRYLVSNRDVIPA